MSLLGEDIDSERHEGRRIHSSSGSYDNWGMNVRREIDNIDSLVYNLRANSTNAGGGPHERRRSSSTKAEESIHRDVAEKPYSDHHTLYCVTCNQYAFRSSSMYTVFRWHIAVLDSQVFKRCLAREYTETGTTFVLRGTEWTKQRKICCGYCGRDWGITATAAMYGSEELLLAYIQIRNFLVTDNNTGTHAVYQNWKDLSFKLPRMKDHITQQYMEQRALSSDYQSRDCYVIRHTLHAGDDDVTLDLYGSSLHIPAAAIDLAAPSDENQDDSGPAGAASIEVMVDPVVYSPYLTEADVTDHAQMVTAAVQCNITVMQTHKTRITSQNICDPKSSNGEHNTDAEAAETDGYYDNDPSDAGEAVEFKDYVCLKLLHVASADDLDEVKVYKGQHRGDELIEEIENRLYSTEDPMSEEVKQRFDGEDYYSVDTHYVHIYTRCLQTYMCTCDVHMRTVPDSVCVLVYTNKSYSNLLTVEMYVCAEACIPAPYLQRFKELQHELHYTLSCTHTLPLAAGRSNAKDCIQVTATQCNTTAGNSKGQWLSATHQDMTQSRRLCDLLQLNRFSRPCQHVLRPQLLAKYMLSPKASVPEYLAVTFTMEQTQVTDTATSFRPGWSQPKPKNRKLPNLDVKFPMR